MSLRPHFDALAQAVCAPVAGADRTTLHYEAESSDFIRFNRALVRQAGHVQQCYGTVGVVAGRRQALGTVTLSGDAASDIRLLLAERDALLAQLPQIPDDEHLLLPDTVTSTDQVGVGALPAPEHVIAAVRNGAEGADFVGLYAGGPVVRGFADSRGQRNWHSVESFIFDWSVYHAGDQAVKAEYAGSHWEDHGFAAKLEASRAQALLLAQPRKTIPPGAYRALLSPVAVADLLGILGWGGFSAKSAKTGTSTLTLLQNRQARFHPAITLVEDTLNGIAPRFQSDGFVKPPQLVLVREGGPGELLASPRTAREYGLAANGANSDESPSALAIAPGTIARDAALARLGTGVYVSNVHYLNYSDRLACRVTGMTRFACFWVEGGELAAPLAVMRFDDSLLRMFGEGLIGLTDEQAFIAETLNYGSRHLGSVTAPGALVEGLRFTL